MAVWYDVLISLRDFLIAQPSLSGVTVKLGAINPNNMIKEVTEGGAIFIARDREVKEKLIKGGDGVIEIMVFCYERSDDKDPADGYQKLSALEDGFNSALTQWAHTVTAGTLGADIIYAEVDETMGDLDAMRPLIGSKKTVRIEWSKRTL